MKIIVFKGGTSTERAVSLVSGEKIAKALQENGHQVILLDTILPYSQIDNPIEVTQGHLINGDHNFVELLMHPEVKSADFIFNALHGGSGENGEVQGIMQTLGYAFNGSGTIGCAIAMDKVVSKLLFERYRIPTAQWQHYNRGNQYTNEEIEKDILRKLGLPVVIKPSCEGSTIGLSIVHTQPELADALAKAENYGNEIIAERYIKGRELTVSVLGNQVLPVLEIIPSHGIYDYDCKYTKGMTRYEVPADINPATAEKIQHFTMLGFKALKCFGYGRMDLILGEDDIPYFLEMNTLPGMTETSLVPKSAAAAGYTFNQLLEKIIELGITQWKKK